MIRVVAIDDEPLALRQLEMYIGKIPFLELVAACPSAAAARPYVERADILYVDINMPDLSGMDFVRSLEHPPLVVFTLRDRIEAARPRAESRPEALTFKLDYKTVRVEPARIRYVESMSEYLKIWLRDEQAPLVVLYSLKRLAEQLPEDRFLRIHRSYLVNLSDIREYSRTSVTLDGGPTLPVGDIYRPALAAVLSGK